MPVRRAALVAALLALLLPALWQPAGGQRNNPTSVGLVYLKQKIFRPGDWVLYKVDGQNERGGTSTDYQRVQIGLEQTYRGEDCFWIETGWGADRERLTWGAVLVSENIFLDSLAELRGNTYTRLMHISNTSDGTPLVVPLIGTPPKTSAADLAARRPTYTEVGTDTLDTPLGRIACRLVEVKRTFRSTRDMPDSTLQQGTISTARRWYNARLVPITGLVLEVEEKVYFQRVWPLGKSSTDFPMHEVGKDVLRIELLAVGHGAKPMISDRVRIATELRGPESIE
jgi:hypothetical protein